MPDKKIVGNIVGLPSPRSDWNQTDEKKADFIKNKPDIEGMKSDVNSLILNAIPHMWGVIYDNTDRLDELTAPPVTDIPTTLEPNRAYNFGITENITLSFPSNANDGDVIYVGFQSFGTLNLVVDTTNTYDFELIPEMNTGYEIYAKYMVIQGVGTWIVKYSEYAGV
jgi:hypothetical protein